MNLTTDIRDTLRGERFRALAMLVGRLLLGAPFVIFGINKYIHQDVMMGVVASAGLPGWVLYFIIPYQIICGLLIWVGFKTAWASFLLGGFCIVAPLLYHFDWTQANALSMFTKDFATAGGFLLLWCVGPGRYSIDGEGPGSRPTRT